MKTIYHKDRLHRLLSTDKPYCSTMLLIIEEIQLNPTLQHCVVRFQKPIRLHHRYRMFVSASMHICNLFYEPSFSLSDPEQMRSKQTYRRQPPRPRNETPETTANQDPSSSSIHPHRCPAVHHQPTRLYSSETNSQ